MNSRPSEPQSDALPTELLPPRRKAMYTKPPSLASVFLPFCQKNFIFVMQGAQVSPGTGLAKMWNFADFPSIVCWLAALWAAPIFVAPKLPYRQRTKHRILAYGQADHRRRAPPERRHRRQRLKERCSPHPAFLHPSGGAAGFFQCSQPA